MTARIVEILVEDTNGQFLDDGETWQGLRVRYRFAPARRFEKFIVVASPGQTFRDLLGVLLTIVANDDGTGFDRRPAVAGANTQLQLDHPGAAAA